ncbi:response regulator [Paenibacillus arenilitoris]|uniref:Response regulator n=1 Tax=Paenibacillus arenilitoris TaxID=2772299 RepID=A0A927CLT6_9BACL|nr:response regulator [Paenibacillus arenilitoris]MBD2869775.1 response regulator [Paenibacillus arenilitoris]
MIEYVVFAAAAALLAVSIVVYRKRGKERRRIRETEPKARSANPNSATVVHAFSARSSGAPAKADHADAADLTFGVHAGILVVDDQPAIRMLLNELFSALGADVYAAERGGTALRLMNEHAIDCVLLDLKLPDMDGIEVLREIRRRHPDVPVILMSAYVEPSEMEEAVRLGVNRLISKPFDVEELREAVLKQLERRFEITT